jgi:hypothetical protein
MTLEKKVSHGRPIGGISTLRGVGAAGPHGRRGVLSQTPGVRPGKASHPTFKESVMHWLRDWFCKGRALPARHRRTHTLRPTLEQLEGRLTPSIAGAVSSVNDTMGNSATYEVHQDGTLWYEFNGSQFVQVSGESNVKSVSASMDNQNAAQAFVVHNDGRLTLVTAQTIANGSPGAQKAYNVKSVVAEGNGMALVIDNQNFLWQFDPNNGWRMPVDSNGPPGFMGLPTSTGMAEFPGQPSKPLDANFSLVDANVSQATPLQSATDIGTTIDTVIALHTDGTLTSDLLQRNISSLTTMNAPDGRGDNMRILPILGMNNTPVGGIQSISSVTAPGSPFGFFLFTVSSEGVLQKSTLTSPFTGGSPTLMSQNLGIGTVFTDVNVGWNSGDFVATTNTGQVFLDGQLMDSQYAVNSAFAGPGGTFYEVTTSGALNQWSPDLHYGVIPADGPAGWWSNGVWHWASGSSWQFGWTHWTEVDSNVSLN